MDGARWAQDDERHRIFIATGDFNIADLEPLSLERPSVAYCRTTNREAATPTPSAATRHGGSDSSSSSSSSDSGLSRARRAGNSRSVWHRGNQGQGFWRALFQ
eukprot:850772-Pyramimonas_sp.AAC.1